MTRSSKLPLSSFVFLLLFSLVQPVLAQPLAQPNWYAPEGYFATLRQELEQAQAQGICVPILQLGDSHIQAGYTTRPLRDSLQRRYGDAGRGWIGWYSLYGSNAPKDYRVSSTGLGWKRELLLRPEGTIPMGVGGYALQALRATGFSIQLATSASPFEQLLLVRTASSSPLIAFPSSELHLGRFSTGPYVVDTLTWRRAHTEVSLSPKGEEGDEAVYAGSILLSGHGGALIHDLGINGAAYRHYATSDYVEQLTLLAPRLLIVSLGTNDSYSRQFDLATFLPQLDEFLSLLQQYLPQTKVLLTTPPPSFFRSTSVRYVGAKRKGQKHRRRVTTTSYQFNQSARVLAGALMQEAERRGIAAFDLYAAMGGEAGVQRWIADGLLAGDRVHYTAAGYERQGSLLTEVLLRALASH